MITGELKNKIDGLWDKLMNEAFSRLNKYEVAFWRRFT